MVLRSFFVFSFLLFSVCFEVVIANVKVSNDTINYFVIEDSEGGNPSQAYCNRQRVTNVFDELKQSRVTFIEGVTHLYKQNNWWAGDATKVRWNIPAKGVSWDIRSNDDFEIMFIVTTSGGTKFLHYYVSSTEKTSDSYSFYFKLSNSYKDGRWHEIKRDFTEDIFKFDYISIVESINLIFIKAKTTLAIDDIRAYPEATGAGDITPPEIHLNGDINVDIKKGKSYYEQGAYATDNVTETESMSVTIDNSDLDITKEGMYRIKYSVADAAGNNAKTVYRVVNVRSPEIVIGPREVFSTPLELGTFFVSVNGSGLGDGSSVSNAVSWSDFLTEKWNEIEAGDVVFFKGGTYNFTESLPSFTLCEGKKYQPVIYESYPGDTAIFDGTLVDSLYIHRHSGNVTLFGNNIWLRKVEFNRLPHWGPRVWGANCIIEGVSSHHNLLSGIELSRGYNTINCIIRDNYLYENSDLNVEGGGSNYSEYDFGGNADGLTMHSGVVMNIVSHNMVYENSDDGVDSWGGQLTVFSYNFIKHQGKYSPAGGGNGAGIKCGSAKMYGTQAFHNITEEINFSDGNYVVALKANATEGVVMAYNTLHKSTFAIDNEASTSIYRNIVLRTFNKLQDGPTAKASIENSYNMIPAFIPPDYAVSSAVYSADAESRMLSIDPNSDDYLRPDPNDLFANIGAYADDDALPDIIPPTVFYYGRPDFSIENGALYIEHGAFAYDAHDGKLDVSISNSVNTKVDGIYVITYTASDAAGNTATYQRRIKVGEGGDVFDDVNDVLDNKKREVEIFPNPSSGIINVRFNNTQSNNIRIRIINMSGMVMSSHLFNNINLLFQTKLDLTTLPNGSYILYGTDGKQSFSNKFIINK